MDIHLPIPFGIYQLVHKSQSNGYDSIHVPTPKIHTDREDITNREIIYDFVLWIVYSTNKKPILRTLRTCSWDSITSTEKKKENNIVRIT